MTPRDHTPDLRSAERSFPAIGLSEAGLQRRDAMLAELLIAQRSLRTRRRRVRGAAGVAGLAMAIAATALLVRPSGQEEVQPRVASQSSPTLDQNARPGAVAPPPAIVPSIRGELPARSTIARLPSDPTVLTRLRVESQSTPERVAVTRVPPQEARSAAIRRLDDQSLIQLLRGAGRPSGLISISGRMRLASPLPSSHAPDGEVRRDVTRGRTPHSA